MPKNALCRKEFTNKDLGLQVRTISNEDGTISINAEDTAIGFGWTQVKNGKIYPKWERVNGYLEELGFSPQVGKDDYIPESLFYRLGMKANNKVANAFQNWLAMEVIPSIRKHGSYMTDDTIEKALNEPDFLIRLATKLKEEKEARLKAEQYAEVLQTENAQQQQIIGELKPKATYYDLVLQNKTLISISVIAKDYGMTAQTMNKKLHELGVQYKTNGNKGIWLLYKEHQAKGYTSSKTQEYVDKDGNPQSRLHTYWTQKGRLFIYDLLKQHGILPLIEIEEQKGA